MILTEKNTLHAAERSLSLARGWLLLAVCALGVGNLMAVVLVLARTPFVSRWLPEQELFRVALVLHVDFSIFIWLLAFGGMIWVLMMPSSFTPCAARWLKRSVLLGLIGAVIMGVSPLIIDASPVLSNYLPVMDSPLFLLGMALFMLGLLIMAGGYLSSLLTGSPPKESALLRLGTSCSVITLVFALATVATTLMKADGTLPYEQLFWGGGHVIQFVYLFLMTVSWLWLGERVLGRPVGGATVLRWFFLVTLMVPAMGPLIPLLTSPSEPHGRLIFTALMRTGSWLLPLIISLILLFQFFQRPQPGRYRTLMASASGPFVITLGLSMLLFWSGIFVGTLIRGDNLLVPAHYHGTTGAINMAFMGLAYHLMPRMGFGALNRRWCRVQLIIYGLGVLLLVSGLAWSGVQGISRKVAGVAQGLDSVSEVASMLLMGVGGGVALLGSFLFLGIVFQAMGLKRRFDRVMSNKPA
jgi:heme/copper-type cytochrome/quinol oxidase subunit 1